MSTCTDCEPGPLIDFLRFPSGLFVSSQVCTGRYSTSNSSTSCKPCSQGFFQDRPGQTLCSSCAPGRFSEQSGLSSCRDCAPGSIAPLAKSRSCTVCLEGTYQDKVGQSACTECDPGASRIRSCVSLAFIRFSSCVGTFSAVAGATGCLLCELGTIAPNKAASKCQSCHPGSVQPAPGQTRCVLCPPGKAIGVDKQSFWCVVSMLHAACANALCC
jgi:hypothetical protein